jgi:hypothetical protein
VQAVDLVAGALGQIGIDPARQHGVGLDVVGRPRAGTGELHDIARPQSGRVKAESRSLLQRGYSFSE